MTPPPVFNDPEGIGLSSTDKTGGGVSHIDLRHIARLSRLHLSEEELRFFETQVAQILSFVDKLKEVNVDGVDPTSHPLSLSNVFRDDEIKPSIAIEEFLKNAPRARGRFFEVPKIIEPRPSKTNE